VNRVLFLVNGLGLGNSTRCHAIIQQLSKRSVQCEVASYGNGLWYFDERAEIHKLRELVPYSYGSKDGELSVGRTLGNIPSLVAAHRENERRIGNWLAEEPPDVVVADSIYAFSAIRRAKIKFVSLNHSDRILGGFQSSVRRGFGLWSQLGAIELPDFLFNLSVPDLVISPSLGERHVSGSFHAVAPIYRENARPSDEASRLRKVVVMLSGSSLARPIRFSANQLPYDLLFVRGEKDSLSKLREADLIVTNAGRSSLSEILAMRKPSVIVPLANHAEQWVNAQALVRQGIAIVATPENLDSKIREAANRYHDLRTAIRKLPVPGNGAVEAADLIQKVPTSF